MPLKELYCKDYGKASSRLPHGKPHTILTNVVYTHPYYFQQLSPLSNILRSSQVDLSYMYLTNVLRLAFQAIGRNETVIAQIYQQSDISKIIS